jgi:hypothetical protein
MFIKLYSLEKPASKTIPLWAKQNGAEEYDEYLIMRNLMSAGSLEIANMRLSVLKGTIPDEVYNKIERAFMNWWHKGEPKNRSPRQKAEDEDYPKFHH